uniref:Uncharacterized protein n=1 Tax=Cacopsylla melanoneura TaxID=428564 RepID=A0A8D8YFV8_9HEMI
MLKPAHHKARPCLKPPENQPDQLSATNDPCWKEIEIFFPILCSVYIASFHEHYSYHQNDSCYRVQFDDIHNSDQHPPDCFTHPVCSRSTECRQNFGSTQYSHCHQLFRSRFE